MENTLKLMIGGIATIVSAMVDGIGLALTILLGLMLIDVVTGILASVYNKDKISSSVGIKGLVKKAYILLLIGSVYMVQNIAEFDLAGYTGDGLAILFAVMEFVSIFENGIRLNIKFPRFLVDLIASKKDKF